MQWLEDVDVFFPRPHALTVDPRGGRFFVASLAENRLAYAPVGDADVDLLAIPGDLHTVVQFAVSPDGRWLVGGGQVSGELMVWDITGEAPELAHTLGLGGGPWHPVFTPDGALLFVPNQMGNRVSVVDTADWTLAGTIEDEHIVAPHGSAVSADGSTVFVSSRNASMNMGGVPMAGHEGHAGHDMGPRPGYVVAIDVPTLEVKGVIEMGAVAVGMGMATPTPR
jgi:DNA-binding beta-propeller fold protein YncE